MDGKTLRGAGPQPLHVVSAVAGATGLSLGRVAGRGKGHELAAVPDLLALLDLRGAPVSPDALSCQPAIAAQIVVQGGDYLLGLKANRPGLLARVTRPLQALPVATATSRWAFAGDGTPVHYQVWVWASGELGWVDEDGRWPQLRTLVRVQTTTQAAEAAVQQRYYASSRALTAAQADGFVRGHWAIENALRWQLDVTFGEDDHQLRHHQRPRA